MTFLIADTFTAALARLTGEEQKAVKTTVFDLQVSAAHPAQALPGLSLHRLDHARDRNFWSARVSGDIRIIVHRTDASLLVCYVDHHDKAYAWAERRTLKVHPTTGAAQLVEVRETVVDIPVHRLVEGAPEPATRYPARDTHLFAHVADAQLLEYGVPEEWLTDVRAATEDSIFTIVARLPAEAAEALIELATGGTPKARIVTSDDPFTHPDARRRFRVLTNAAELEQALDAPWERWAVFLHPEQRELVERRFNGPARVAGSAGTGKTVVALHRAVALARANPEAQVLLTTFSIPLARLLRQRLAALVGSDDAVAARITVDALDEVVIGLHERVFGQPQVATATMVSALIATVAAEQGQRAFSTAFLQREWDEVVDAWQVSSWEAYRDVPRLGRKHRLSEAQRQVVWAVFEEVVKRLDRAAMTTVPRLYRDVTASLGGDITYPYDFVVVDEAQDVSVPQLRFLAALGGRRPDALFFAGDQGQRIFQLPFSWKSLGVDVRGRSQVLRVNYRTSHQIRSMADRLLDEALGDVDGIVEQRGGTVSVFDGPSPEVVLADSVEHEAQVIADWLAKHVADGVQPGAIGVFVRSRREVDRARSAIARAGLSATSPAPGAEAEPGKVVLMPMHLAKGLEFRVVVVAACDEDVLPLQDRLETAGDDSDLDDIYKTERYLLYVACTRARDALLVTAVAPGSEFLGDLRPQARSRSP
ncbi:MAG: UvrD-helicase domain-containing protein [Gemmatimonadetes bacterium]|nr:UvrD-helicase domain-containing protein [Gemmatimonadota bacterium]